MNSISNEDITGIRKTFKKFGVIIAEVDKNLRYKWIDNPHPDFSAESVVGKRDDELLPKEEASEIVGFKERILKNKKRETITLLFQRSNGPHYYNMIGYPVLNSRGQVISIITIGFNTEIPDTVKRARL
jgi:hypothetical protein